MHPLKLLVTALLYFSVHGTNLNCNGGYEDVVVSIGNSVPTTNCQQLIESIQKLFTRASAMLNTRTKGRNYFHNIEIILPYGAPHCDYVLPRNSSTFKSKADSAALRIEADEHPIHKDKFWTQKPQRCGKVGSFVSVVHQTIRQGGKNNPPDNVDAEFLYEWEKYNDGTYEESGFRYIAECANTPYSRNGFSRNRRSNSITPVFTVKRIGTPKILLILEDSRQMKYRWIYLSRAIRKFITHDVPNNTEVGIVAISPTDVRVLAPVSKLRTRDERSRMASSLPFYSTIKKDGIVQVELGVLNAFNLLEQYDGIVSGSVIIVASGGNIQKEAVQQLVKMARQQEVAITVVEYSTKAKENISLLASGTMGSYFHVPSSDVVHKKSYVGAYIHLTNAFTAILRQFLKGILKPLPNIVHQREYTANEGATIHGRFLYEAGISQEPAELFLFQRSPINYNVYTIELTNPDGETFSSICHCHHDILANKAYKIINSTGAWSYNAQRRVEGNESHFVQVVNKVYDEEFQFRIFTNVGNGITANLNDVPLIIYAEVKYKNCAIVKSNVDAFVEAGLSRFLVQLRDNGNGAFLPIPAPLIPNALITCDEIETKFIRRGTNCELSNTGTRITAAHGVENDADLTQDDGIYSRYFVPTSIINVTTLTISATIITGDRGTYLASARCYGSDGKQHGKISVYERFLPAITVKVKGLLDSTYPPGRIGDLMLGSVNGSKVTLRWTAPGQHLDHGAPSYYKVLQQKEFGVILLKTFAAALEAGFQESVTVQLPSYGEYEVAITATNSNGEEGKLSNIVKVRVPSAEKDAAAGAKPVVITSGNDIYTILPLFSICVSAVCVNIALLVYYLRHRFLQHNAQLSTEGQNSL